MNTKDIILNKEKNIMAAAELAANETNDWQAVRAFLTRRLNEMQLTPKQQEKLEIYQFAYNQLVSGRYTENEVVEMIISEYSCNKGAALQHLRDSKEVFSSAFNINKQFELKIQLEINRIQLQKAAAKGDLKNYASLEKNRIKMIDLSKELEEENHDDFEGHVITPVFDPSILGYQPIEKKELESLLKTLNERFGGNISVENIEDIEIIDESESPL